ncbi:MAG: hypothetical protein AB7P01_13705 [Bacteroidia bacterium]
MINGYEKLSFIEVVKADICRKIRNHIVHNPKSLLPNSLGDPIVTGWIDEFKSNISKTNWLKTYDTQTLHSDIEKGFQEMIDNAEKELKKASPEKGLKIEFFYMIFTFTTLTI